MIIPRGSGPTKFSDTTSILYSHSTLFCAAVDLTLLGAFRNYVHVVQLLVSVHAWLGSNPPLVIKSALGTRLKPWQR